jgi:RNA polymerase sigma-70 factor (ECF subfamily)
MDDVTADALRAAAGDQAALSDFVRATQPDVWRLCAFLVDVASADDVTQDVYARAIAALPAFRGEASARTWVLTITYRTCADELRRRRRRRVLQARLTITAPRAVVGADESVGVSELSAGLQPAERSALVLTQLLGLRYQDAATVLGVPVGTVRSRVARARRQLIVELDENATGQS